MSEGMLFDKGEWWEEDWQGMPEFIQRDLTPWKSIYVHFANEQDMRKLSELLGQTITVKTQSIWFPEPTIDKYSDKRYIDDAS